MRDGAWGKLCQRSVIGVWRSCVRWLATFVQKEKVIIMVAFPHMLAFAPPLPSDPVNLHRNSAMPVLALLLGGPLIQLRPCLAGGGASGLVVIRPRPLGYISPLFAFCSPSSPLDCRCMPGFRYQPTLCCWHWFIHLASSLSLINGFHVPTSSRPTNQRAQIASCSD